MASAGSWKWSLPWRHGLKSLHILVAAMWMGSAACLVLIARPGVSGDVVASMQLATHIDDWLLVPSAVFVFITGVLYGFYTKWGFVRFRWVIVKWLVSVLSLGFGALFLGPWIETLAALSQELGVDVHQNTTFETLRARVFMYGGIQFVVLASLVPVSVYKPWGRRS